MFTEKKNVSLERFIYSLGIPGVGKKAASILANHYKSIEAFISNAIKGNLEDVRMTEWIGDNVVDGCTYFFNDEYFKQMALNLACQVNIIETPNIAGHLSGLSFVFTGTLDLITRNEAKRLAEKNGARVLSDISRNTDYVVVGSNAGRKASKAQELGIRAINENEFLNMCISK